MIPSDQRPPGQDWLVRRITDLERQVRELQAGRRLEAATIGQGGMTVKGGTITVKGGGQVLVEDDTGTRLIWLGKVPFGDGTTKPGLVAFRSNADGGGVALSLYDGIFAAWDRQGHIVLSTDEVSGQGHARPWLPIAFAPADFTTWPATVNATFESVLETFIARQQPKVYVLLRHTADVSGTTGEVRVMCNGVQLGATASVGFVINYTEIGPIALPAGTYSERVQITVEARRTAGTGKVRATVAGAWTQQS